MNLDKKFFSTSRIAALSDGIFAIAMTLLVLNISIPDSELVKQIGLLEALNGQIQEFISYFLSFFLLGIFWIIQHKQMNVIEQTDSTYIWLNILLLLFICLIPFSSSLQSDFINNPISSAIFNGNMLIIGICFLINWMYATKNHKLIPKDYSNNNIVRGKMNVLIFIFVTIAATIFGLFAPEYSGMVYILVPILKAIIK